MRDSDEIPLGKSNYSAFTLGEVVYYTRKPDDVLTCMITAIQQNDDGRFMYEVSPIRFSITGDVIGLSPAVYYTYEESLESNGAVVLDP